MTCSCNGPGWCEAFGRTMAAEGVAICRDEVLTPEKCAVYRANWLRLKNRPTVEGDVPAPPGDFQSCCSPPR